MATANGSAHITVTSKRLQHSIKKNCRFVKAKCIIRPEFKTVKVPRIEVCVRRLVCSCYSYNYFLLVYCFDVVGKSICPDYFYKLCTQKVAGDINLIV